MTVASIVLDGAFTLLPPSRSGWTCSTGLAVGAQPAGNFGLEPVRLSRLASGARPRGCRALPAGSSSSLRRLALWLTLLDGHVVTFEVQNVALPQQDEVAVEWARFSGSSRLHSEGTS